MNTDPMTTTLFQQLFSFYMASLQSPGALPFNSTHTHNTNSLAGPAEAGADAESRNQRRNQVYAEAIGRQYLLKALQPLSVEDALASIPLHIARLPLQALTPRQATDHFKQKERYFVHKARRLQSELVKYDDDIAGRSHAITQLGQDYLTSIFGPNYSGGWGFELTPSAIYGDVANGFPSQFYDAAAHAPQSNAGTYRLDPDEFYEDEDMWEFDHPDDLAQYDDYLASFYYDDMMDAYGNYYGQYDLYGDDDVYDYDDPYAAYYDMAEPYGGFASHSRGVQPKFGAAASAKRGGRKKRSKAQKGKVAATGVSPRKEKAGKGKGKGKGKFKVKAGNDSPVKHKQEQPATEIKPYTARGQSSTSTNSHPSNPREKQGASAPGTGDKKDQESGSLGLGCNTTSTTLTADKMETNKPSDTAASQAGGDKPTKNEVKYQLLVFRKPFKPSKRPHRDCWNGRVYL